MKSNLYPADYLPDTLSLVLTHFQICQTDIYFSVGHIQSFEDLAKRLQIFIKKLLCEDFARLVNTLYLIDVGEESFREAMQNNDLETVAHQITELVLKREVLKVSFRKGKF